MSVPRILVIGHGGSGKTLVGDILAEMYDTTCTNTGDLILAGFQLEQGESIAAYHHHKNEFRQDLYDFAVERMGNDPAYYVREALQRGAIVTGVRRREEFAASRGMFDLCMWKDAPQLTADATDGLIQEQADCVMPWCDDPGAGLGEAIGERVEPLLQTPEVYIVGRYRHWKPNGEWDHERMDAMADEEAEVAAKLRVTGVRTFCPIATHAPVDDFWGRESARRILTLCEEKLRRMRHRDAICIRDGWRDVPNLPDSEGTEEEIAVAVQRGLNVLYTQHGDEALRRACEMLLGRAQKGPTR